MHLTSLTGTLEGKRGIPRIRPPFPAVAGLYQCPTILNNVETFANLHAILTMGGNAYGAIGTPDSSKSRVSVRRM